MINRINNTCGPCHFLQVHGFQRNFFARFQKVWWLTSDSFDIDIDNCQMFVVQYRLKKQRVTVSMERHFNIMETIKYKRRKYSQLKLYRIMPKYFIASYINNYSMIYLNECKYVFTVMFRIQPSPNAINTENKIGKKKKTFVYKFPTTLANLSKFQWRGIHRTSILA